MKFQTNPPLGPFINHWGCHFSDILQKVEKTGGYPKWFSNDDVLTIYYRSMAEGYLQREQFNKNETPLDGCTVQNGDKIFNLGAELLGIPFRATDYRHEAADYVPKAGEEEILELKRKGYNGSHFVSGTNIVGCNWKKEIEFDSVEGGSNCSRDGWIESKRILTIVKI